MKLIDQIGITHSFEILPQRIISLVPSQTELIYDLGQESKLIGLTKFCVHPVGFKKTKQIIGGTKNIHFDKIKALQPDLIIANKEENTKEIVEQLSQICPVWVTNIITVEDNQQMVSDFGKLLDCENEARKWVDKIDAAYHDFQIFIKEKPFKKTAYFIWAKPYMVAGSDNFINELLKLNHFQNIYGEGRYPEIQLERITEKGNPELVLLSSEPYPFKEKHIADIQQFIPKAKIILVDGEMFSWYGSRLLKAFDYFKALHSTI